MRLASRARCSAIVALFCASSAPSTLRAQDGAAPLIWAECGSEQIQVLILGTYHFHAVRELDDILREERQRELSLLLDRLAVYVPDRIAVEFAYARSDSLDRRYRDYLAQQDEQLGWRNEIGQIGFRLARRLGHDRVYAVDVPMNLWHDSIAVFDERYPEARDSLRARWDIRLPDPRSPEDLPQLSLTEALRILNTDRPPANWEMYGGFLPLVADEIYAGALKLRPWYDRNLRIVSNIFRITEPTDERVLLVIGSGHLRALKQILEFTPQLCPVSALPYLED